MSRSTSTEAIVLKTYPIGEQHRGVLLATANRGTLHTIAHGAASPRSKLRTAAAPLSVGTAVLYEDPSKGSIKITEWDPILIPDGLRSQVRAFFAANIAAETIILGHTPAESDREFALFRGLVEALDEWGRQYVETAPQHAAEQTRIVSAETILVCYLWKFLKNAGVLPDLDYCARSGVDICEQKEAWYSASAEGFLHKSEAGFDHVHLSDEIYLPAPGFQMIRWLAERPFERTRLEALPRAPLSALYGMAVQLLQAFLGKKLKAASAASGSLRF